MRKLFRILGEHRLRISIGTMIIILIVFFAYIRIGIGDFVAHNANNTSMIGIEMLCESGPNFKLAAEHHIEMLQGYSAHMENKYQKVPVELVGDIRTAVDKSKKSLERFKKNLILENAVFLCEDDRSTMLLLFLARAGYNSSHEKLFQQFYEFHELEKEVSAEEQKLFDRLPDDDPQMRKRFIGHIIQSEQRRLNVLEALKIPDMRKARTLMWETISIAYHEREPILEFTAAVAFGEGKGWERPSLKHQVFGLVKACCRRG